MVYPLDDIRTLVLIRAVAGLIGRGRLLRRRIGSALAQCGQIQDIITVLNRLDGSGLDSTTCHEVELGLATQVLEISSRSEEQVHHLDVVGGKLLQRGSGVAADGDTEDAQLAKLHLVAIEQLLHEASAGVAHHALHRTTGKHPVVIRDVLHKLIEAHHLRHLVLGIRHLRSLVGQRTFPHESRIIDHIDCPSSVWDLVLTPAVHSVRPRLLFLNCNAKIQR